MTKKKPQKKSRYPKLGTDEAFFQLMTVSGSSILKLLGMPATQAANYRFRAIVLKDKKLQPDIEGIPILQSDQSRVIIEFQGYEDKFIRYRLATEVFWSCLQEEYAGPVLAAIIFTDAKYQAAALPLASFPAKRNCRWKGCWLEIVLTNYTEAELLAIDPRLVVLAAFTVAKDTDKTVLFEKGANWQALVKQVFPASQQPQILNIIGLLVLDRFSHLTYQEVRTMLNLDLSKSVAVRQVRQMARAKGREEGLAKGRKEGRTEGRAEGRAEGLVEGRSEGLVEGRAEGLVVEAQEMVMEALDERFGQVPKRLSDQLRQIQQRDVLKMLLRQAVRCQNLSQFKKVLVTQMQ
jgi:predicted transposase YdaD